jgi:para-nitrobenzyl esterase
MQEYFANFIKSGDPNGPGLPAWPAANRGAEVPVIRFGVDSHAEPEPHRERYRFLDSIHSRSRRSNCTNQS